ncbi:MAG TPA: membrane protein insertase YidC [Caulobacteraceae bacterium]|nr:membrane protein insertase YidC [Caulobacteraceae bacterium]
MSSENRNSLIAIVIFMVLFGAYEYFLVYPATKKAEAQRRAQAVAEQTQAPTTVGPATFLPRAQALAQSPRVAIDTPTLKGSIALTGARLDDLFLTRYPVSLDKGAPPVELLRPAGMEHAYFVMLGWQGQNLPGMPGPDSLWTQTGGQTLSPGHPVALRYASPQGLTFDRTIAVDDKYMFTITDKVTNGGAAAVSLIPNGVVQRNDIPADLGKNNIVHEGGIGVLGGTLKEDKYSQWKKDADKRLDPDTGWMGVTDKYWMAVMIPPGTETISPEFKVEAAGALNIYAASYTARPVAIGPGQAVSVTNRIFAGPKARQLLNSYANVPKFQDAIDWGHLYPLTKAIHWLLEFFYGYVHNYGVAILMLTVVIRLSTFPLANRGYEMGIKMRKLAPLQKELQERYKDDPQTYQREYMALLQREKLNPVTGCLPQLLVIPVFYSLTKVFTVAIDLRQAPFFGWIHDLAAPDPSTIFNLFGIIPWDVFHTPWVQAAMALPVLGGIFSMVLHLGVWPIAYGLSMWISQAMTPQTGIDPTQQLMFKLMPVVFTFILSQYAVGLLIYWSWSSVITVIQSYVLMRRYKVDNPIDDFIARITGKPAPAG